MMSEVKERPNGCTCSMGVPDTDTGLWVDPNCPLHGEPHDDNSDEGYDDDLADALTPDDVWVGRWHKGLNAGYPRMQVTIYPRGVAPAVRKLPRCEVLTTVRT
jgi:hypothetical protein